MSENAEQPTSSPLTSSAEASHARMSAQQARALASAVIEAASGTSSCGSSERCGPESLLWRMLPAELLAGLMRCEVTWQGVTMTAYRSRCRRLIAGLGIAENVSFLLPSGTERMVPTPNAMDATEMKLGESLERWTRRAKDFADKGQDLQVPLAIAVKLLPTPLADDTGHRKSKYQQGGTPLSMAANLLNRAGYVPTPTAGDAKASGSRNTENSAAHYGLSLTDAVRGDGGVGRLPTSTVNDSKNNGAPSQSRRQSPNLNAVAVPAGGPLNPPWIEWLMGFPIGWTDCEPSEMR